MVDIVVHQNLSFRCQCGTKLSEKTMENQFTYHDLCEENREWQVEARVSSIRSRRQKLQRE
jgi:hypothetical protein